MEKAEKIYFRVVRDTDGYPPVDVESVWATKRGVSEQYVLDNVPFFAKDATIGDVVEARKEDGKKWFARIICRSPNSLIRIVFFDEGALERVNATLVGLGCSTEYLKSHNVLAVSVPKPATLEQVQDYLAQESSGGSLDYEEPILRI